MHIFQLTPPAANEDVRRLYETAFPKEEQIPWNDLMCLIKTMSLDFTVYYEDCDEFADEKSTAGLSRLLGLTIVYPRKEFNWFWYFAVPEELRGQGIGQRILTQLLERYKDEQTEISVYEIVLVKVAVVESGMRANLEIHGLAAGILDAPLND